MPIRRFFFPLLLLTLLSGMGSRPLKAQTVVWQDTVRAQTKLLSELTQSGNFEKAVVEAGKLRLLMTRQKTAYPPSTVSLLSNIYWRTKNEDGGLHFLEEAEAYARQENNLLEKATLLSVLSREYERWQLPEKALFMQRQVAAVQDSLTARQVRLAHAKGKRQLDSLQRFYQISNADGGEMVKMEKDRALLLGGVLGSIFLLLLVANFRTQHRWRKKMETRELEMDIERSVLHTHEHTPPPAFDPVEEKEVAIAPPPAVVTAPPQTVAPIEKHLVEVATTKEEHIYHPSSAGEPTQHALLIEPNRQIVLYLKSLLSDRFQIETVDTPNEGLQKAHNLLPDLIICDAVLNGKTGIDVARQIKLSERTNHIPVILLTEKFGNEGKLDALRAGADAWFNRPVLDDEFDGQVNRLVATQKERHAQFNRVVNLYFTESRIVPDNPFLLETVRMIEQHLPDPDFTPDVIARKLQMPNTLFVRKLKALTGKSPIQLLREMRLEKAKVLLEKRAAMPQIIAELVGYSNPGTFALAFKDYFGENTLLLQMPVRRLPGRTQDDV